jgi:AcrR family transcriptional regulator
MQSAILHSVTESATSRKRLTQRRIVAAAQELAIERGYDGFTLDELAAQVGVSRRTLFNHVAGKEEAVLGPRPDLDPDALAAFRAGGPTGDLFNDLMHLVIDLLDREGKVREDGIRFHRLLETNPALGLKVHQKFEEICAEMAALAAERPGERDPYRARVAITLLGALFAIAMNEFIGADDESTLLDHVQLSRQAASELNI